MTYDVSLSDLIAAYADIIKRHQLARGRAEAPGSDTRHSGNREPHPREQRG